MSIVYLSTKISIPIYPFIDHKVCHEQHIYEENRNKGNDVKNIYFSSIEKQKTVRYIFDFIRFIRGLQYNNGVYEFTTVGNIKAQLTKQWAAHFKELLRNRHHYIKNKEIEQDLSKTGGEPKAILLRKNDHYRCNYSIPFNSFIKWKKCGEALPLLNSKARKN